MFQILINSIISGLLLALVALGFNIIFSATRIFHLAHGAVYVIGVYVYYLLAIYLYLPFLVSLILALIIGSFAGYLIENLIYRPLMRKATNQNITLISSLGVFIIVVNCIAIFGGNETKMLTNSISESTVLGNIIITKPQFLQIVVCIPVIFIFIFFLQYTGYGLKIRAVSDNPTLAVVTGIKLKNVRNLVFTVGSIMAVISGLLKAYDTGLDPYSGMAITLSAAVAVIIGGSGSFYGTLSASILLAVVQNYIEYFLSAQWRDPITFAILIVVLLLRTEGIIQFNIRTDER